MRRLYNHVTETSTMNIEIETLVMLTAGKIEIGALRTVQIILALFFWPKYDFQLKLD